MFRRITLLVSLFFGFAGTAALADFDAGVKAHQAGDYMTAFKEFSQVAAEGDGRAQYNLGIMYYHGQGVPQDYKEAAAWYRKAAEQGDASAQLNLGFMYGNGQGVPQNYKEEAAWYLKAAEQGHASAQSNLGVMYDNGLGVPQDYKEAVAWYRNAAEQGHASAQSNLGVMYYNGLGVPQLKVVAYALFNLSASGDPSEDNKASQNRARMAESMNPRELEAGQNLTRELTKPGNFLKALDKYISKPTVKEKSTRVANDDPVTPANQEPPTNPYPARPAKRPGVTSCNTRCVNGDCWRTYDDGHKVRFQAKRKWDSFSGSFEWDSGGC